ncbi:MAG: transposase [Alphaproteobacteria bacterium]|nr:transposase [Alphaproteobacteria bacterium]
MKAKYTAAELAALKLDGLPSTTSALIRLASREQWAWQAREGRGGGREYPFKTLPAYVREAILAHDLAAVTSAGQAVELPTLPAPDEATTKGEARRDAKLQLLVAVEAFRKRTGLGQIEAERRFAALYNAFNGGSKTVADLPEITGIPAWVRAARPSTSLNSLRRYREARSAGCTDELAGRYAPRQGGTLEHAVTADGRKVLDVLISLHAKQPQTPVAELLRQLSRALGAGCEVMMADTGEVAALDVSLRTAQRSLAEWKARNEEAWLRMTNPDAWRSKYKLALGERDAGIVRPNQLWEIDASPADVLLTEGRFSVYVAVDVYTRRMMVLVTKTPRAAAVVALVRRAMIAWGVPEVIKTDNGSDFKARHVQQVFVDLEIKPDVCDAYQPDQKPHVERAIGTLQHSLMPTLPGYVGHNVATAQAIRSRRTFAARMGEKDREVFAVALDHHGLQTEIDNWVDGTYHQNGEHAALGGLSPFQQAASWTGALRRIGDERALDVLLAPLAGRGSSVVGKKGIRVDGGEYWCDGLPVGQRVMVRQDPHDLGRVHVFSEDGGTFIGIAEDLSRLGEARRQVAVMARQRHEKALRETVGQIRAAGRGLDPAALSAAARADAAEQARNIVAFPARTVTHRTDALDAAAEAVLAAAAPRQAPALSEADQDVAAEQLARIEAKAMPAPAQVADERPGASATDETFALWVLRHADAECVDDYDRQVVAEMLKKSPTLRMQVEPQFPQWREMTKPRGLEHRAALSA